MPVDYGPGIIDSNQIDGMVRQGMAAALASFNQALPALFNGLTANPYTVRGFENLTNMAPQVAASLFSPYSLPGQFVTQPLMGRAAFMQGVQQYMAFPGGQGPMGLGFGMPQMQEMFRFARQEMPQATSMELAQIISGGGQIGAFSAVRTVEQFRQQFRELVRAVRQVTEALGTSLQESLQMMQQIRGMGFFTPGAQAQALQQLNQASYFSGIAPQALMGMTQQMTPMIRQWGGGTQQASYQTGLRALTLFGAAQQMGLIGEEQIVGATGLTSEQGGLAALAQQYLTSASERMGRFGRQGWFTAALIDPTTGRADPEMIQRMQMGQLGGVDIQREARRRAGMIGPANWRLNRRRYSQEILAADPFAELEIYRNILQERGMSDMDDPRARILLGRLSGASNEQLDVMLPLIQNLPVLRIQEALSSQQQTRQQQFQQRLEQRTPDFIRRLSESVESVQNKIEEQVISVAEKLENYAIDSFHRMSGTTQEAIAREWMRPSLRGVTGAAAREVSGIAAAARATVGDLGRRRPSGLTVQDITGATFEQLAPAAFAAWTQDTALTAFGAGGDLAEAQRRLEAMKETRPGEYYLQTTMSRRAAEALTSALAVDWARQSEMPWRGEALPTTYLSNLPKRMQAMAAKYRNILQNVEDTTQMSLDDATNAAWSLIEAYNSVGSDALLIGTSSITEGMGEDAIAKLAESAESRRARMGNRTVGATWRLTEEGKRKRDVYLMGVKVAGYQPSEKIVNEAITDRQYQQDIMAFAMRQGGETWKQISQRIEALGFSGLLGYGLVGVSAATTAAQAEDVIKAYTEGIAKIAGIDATGVQRSARATASLWETNRESQKALVQYTVDSAKIDELNTRSKSMNPDERRALLLDQLRVSMPHMKSEDLNKIVDDPNVMRALDSKGVGAALSLVQGMAGAAALADEAAINQAVRDQWGLTTEQVDRLKGIKGLGGAAAALGRLIGTGPAPTISASTLGADIGQITKTVLGADERERARIVQEMREAGATSIAAMVETAMPYERRIRRRGLGRGGARGMLELLGVEGASSLSGEALVRQLSKALDITEEQAGEMIRGGMSKEAAADIMAKFEEALLKQVQQQQQIAEEKRKNERADRVAEIKDGTSHITERLNEGITVYVASFGKAPPPSSTTMTESAQPGSAQSATGGEGEQQGATPQGSQSVRVTGGTLNVVAGGGS